MHISNLLTVCKFFVALYCHNAFDSDLKSLQKRVDLPSMNCQKIFEYFTALLITEGIFRSIFEGKNIVILQTGITPSNKMQQRFN